MTTEDVLELLRDGKWNQWREENLNTEIPSLEGAELHGADLGAEEKDVSRQAWYVTTH